MAIDIETIGVAVDSSGLTKGTRELDKFSQSADKASKGADNIGKASANSSSQLSGLATVASRAAIGVAAVGASAFALGATLLKTYLEVDKLNKILQFSTGSAANAAKELDYLKQVTNELGLEFNTTALSYAKFAAASKGTNLEGQKTRDIFESIAKASTVLGLSADETGGALKAIEQIISKGTVSAEELRGQLGERLPGAFQIAARAMGVTTQELGKMLEQGQLVSDVFLPKFAEELTKTLGDSPTSAAGSAQAQLNRLSNAWIDFKKAIAETGVINIVVKGAETATAAINGLNFTLFGKAKKDSITDRASNFFNPIGESILNLFGVDSANQKAGKKANANKVNSGIKFGGNIDSAVYAPSFGVTKKDGQGGYDASTNTPKTNYAKAISDADAIRKHKEDNANKLYAIEKELSDIISEREFKHLKLVRETTDKNNKKKEDNANKFYALEKELSDTISDREFKHLERVREIKENTAKEQLKAQQDLAKDINKSLTDALLRGFESGKGFAKNFRDTLINMFKTLVLSPTISAILKPVTDSVSGILSGGVGNLLGGGTSAAGGGIFGSASNLLSVGKSIYSGFSSSLSSNIGGLVANLSPKLGSAIAGKMLGSAAGLGPTVAGSATGIGSIAGSVGSLGSAISTALPYIGLAIGAFSLIKSLSKKNSYANGTFNSSYVGGAFSQGSSSTNSRGALAVGALPAINELTETFATRLGTLFKTFGLSDKQNFKTQIKFGKNLEAAFGSVSAAGGGAGVDGYGPKNYGSDAKAGMEKFIADVLGKGLQGAIVSSSLSDGIKGLFKGLTDQTQVVNMINATSSLKEAQKELADKFGLTVDMAGKVASASGRAGDALGEFVKALSTVAMSGSTIGAQLIKSKDKLFGDFNTVFGDVITEAVLSTVSRQVPIATAAAKTDFLGRTIGAQNRGLAGILGQSSSVQQFKTVTEQVTTFITRVASRNLQLPKTIADYDDLLKNIPKASEAGQKMFADVFALRDQFIAKINAENGLKGNLRSGLSSIVSDAEKQTMLNEDLATLFGELKMAVPATIQELINAGKNALAQLNLGTATEATYNLAAAFPNLVSAFKETKDGIVELVASLRDESGFKTLYDFNFYKGIAGNYGNEFANRLNDGAKVSYGASNNTSVAMANNVVPINNTTISSSDPNMLNAMNVLIGTVNNLQTRLVNIEANTNSAAVTLRNVSQGGDKFRTVAS